MDDCIRREFIEPAYDVNSVEKRFLLLKSVILPSQLPLFKFKEFRSQHATAKIL